MATETLKLVITADNADALAKIKQFSESLGAQTREFERNRKATGDATYALTNFSRLAEDSAYGIRGAANNINPFIESFKRLKDETGSTKAALMSMVQGLIGPAGILVAVSAISAIWIKYSDSQQKAKKEAEELAKANGTNADTLKKQKEEIEGIYQATAKESTQVSTLVAILNSETESRNRKLSALKELQKINPEIFQGLKLEGTVVVGINDAYKQYIDNLSTIIALKIKQKELEDVTEKLLKNQGVTLSEDEKFIKKVGEAYRQNRINTANDVEARKIATQVQAEKNKKESEEIVLLEKRDRILKAIQELSKGAKITGEGNLGGDKKDPYIEATKDFNNAVKANLELLSAAKISQESYFANYLEIIKSYVNKLKGIDTTQAQEKLKALTPKELTKKVSDTYDADLEAKAAAMDAFDKNPLKRGANILGNEATPFNKEAFESGKKEFKDWVDEVKKGFKIADEDAKRFANTLANVTTNAVRGMWEAMKKGENVLEALGNAFLNLAEDIAFAILKAQILKSLEVALDIGTAGTGGGGGGIIALLAKVLGGGMAEGGIVSRPTLTMVGEGNEHEAVMPLSKLSGFLNTSFNAGAMTSGSVNGGQFVLKGNDLVLALQRSNSNLNLRRGI